MSLSSVKGNIKLYYPLNIIYIGILSKFTPSTSIDNISDA